MGFEPTNGGFADLSLRPLVPRPDAASIAKSAGLVRVPAPIARIAGGQYAGQKQQPIAAARKVGVAETTPTAPVP